MSLAALLALFSSTICLANSVHLGVSHSEQVTALSDRNLRFSPTGATLFLTLDVTDKLSVSSDYTDLSDAVSLSNQVQGDYALSNWGLGASYDWHAWSVSVSYSLWQDSLNIMQVTQQRSLYNQDSRSPSTAVIVGYHWSVDQWQIGTAAGLHYGQWRQKLYALDRVDRRELTAIDKGEASFVSVSLNAARFHEFSGKHKLMFGAGLGWNQLTSSDSHAISRNGRNVNTISNRGVLNLISSSVVGSESYGQVNLFISYDVSQAWLVDISTSLDFGTEQNTKAWSLNLGYLF